MKTLIKMRFIPVLLILLLVAMMAAPAIMAAGQPKVELLTTVTFAVLSGETITNTGATTINGDAGGDIGIYAGSAITAPADITLSGQTHIDDPVAIQAKTDLAAAYVDAAGRTPVTTIPSELGGQTLVPGVYKSDNGAFKITGTLTLNALDDPEGVFIFQAASTLITAVSSNVDLIRSARYCRVFWQVTSSVTLGANSTFRGHIFALTTITANDGAFIQGQLLARNGAVNLNHNIITNGFCEDTTSSLTPTATVSSGSSSGGSGSSSGGSGSIPPTGDNSMDMAIFLFALVTISTVTVFVIRKKITNK